MFTAEKECKKGNKKKEAKLGQHCLKSKISNAVFSNAALFILFLEAPTELTATLLLYDLLQWPTTKDSLSIITATHPAELLSLIGVMNISRTS